MIAPHHFIQLFERDDIADSDWSELRQKERLPRRSYLRKLKFRVFSD